MASDRRVALVLGATGNIGAGAVRAFLQDKYIVVAPSRSQHSVEKLKAQLGSDLPSDDNSLHAIVEDISTQSGIERVRDYAMSKLGRIDAVTSSMGPWQSTPPLHETSWERWREAHLANYESHFLAWRTIVPVMKDREGASYTFITGSTFHNPNSGVTGICANALYGFAQTVMAESKDFKMRVNNLFIYIRIEDDDTFNKLPEPKPEGTVPNSKFGRIFAHIAREKNTSVRGRNIPVETVEMWEGHVRDFA